MSYNNGNIQHLFWHAISEKERDGIKKFMGGGSSAGYEKLLQMFETLEEAKRDYPNDVIDVILGPDDFVDWFLSNLDPRRKPPVPFIQPGDTVILYGGLRDICIKAASEYLIEKGVHVAWSIYGTI